MTPRPARSRSWLLIPCSTRCLTRLLAVSGEVVANLGALPTPQNGQLVRPDRWPQRSACGEMRSLGGAVANVVHVA